MRTVLAWLCLGFLAGVPSTSAQVNADSLASRPVPSLHLATSDPLLARVPEDVEALSLPQDHRPAPEKVVSDLWLKAVEAPVDSRLSVIVTLHEPLLDGRFILAPEAAESRRIQAIAAVELQFAATARELGMQALRGQSHLPIVMGTVPVSSLADIAALPQVRAVEPDREFQISRVEGGNLIKATQLRNQFGGGGQGVAVAVIDSGISVSHPELASQVIAQGDYTGTTGDGTVDDNGHGTKVAGIIAGTMGGVAPQAGLWALKTFTAAGSSQQSWTIAALNDAYANRNSFGGLDIVNMSLGDGTARNAFCDALYPSLALAVGQLWDAGISVFAASGNDGFLNGVSSPACLTKTIAVGAVYDANIGPVSYAICSDSSTAADQIPCYSNSGPPLDILAPAHCARSPTPQGDYDNCFGGTSASAPYAAGVAAQILSLIPSSTPLELLTALYLTGRPRPDVNGITRNRIDAVAAYEALVGSGPTEPCVPSDTVLCIDDQPGDRRFEVTMHFDNAQNSGFAHAIPLSSLGVNRGGLFWIGSATNPEMLIKVLNACVPPFNAYWVFYAATTNQGLETIVTDTQTGRTWRRTNPRGTAAPPIQDTGAFPCD